MTGQNIKITIKSSKVEPYTFLDLIETIGLDNEWVVAGTSSAGDRNDNDPNFYAELYREPARSVTLNQFCQQTGLDEEIILSFEVV